MIGRVQYNGSLGSIRLHQHTQSSDEAGYSGNRIIRRVNSMPNIFHRSGITNSQKKIADARRIEKRSVNQQTSTKQPYKYVLGPAKNQPSVWGPAKKQYLPSLSYLSGRSIKEQFSSKRGDLVYGLGLERFKLLQRIYPSDQLKDTHIQCIDSMNEAKRDCAWHAVYKGSANDEYTQLRKNHESFEDIDAYIHTMRRQDAIGEKDQKFNTRKRFEDFYKLEKKLTGAREKLDDDSLRLLSKEFYNIIKRSCKAGIMAVTLDSSKYHIHFSLDGIDMNSVVTKNSSYSPINMPSYTGVELRCAYRLREQLKGKLHFYENGVEVSAPWEREPELWRKYTPKSS